MFQGRGRRAPDPTKHLGYTIRVFVSRTNSLEYVQEAKVNPNGCDRMNAVRKLAGIERLVPCVLVPVVVHSRVCGPGENALTS